MVGINERKTVRLRKALRCNPGIVSEEAYFTCAICVLRLKSAVMFRVRMVRRHHICTP